MFSIAWSRMSISKTTAATSSLEPEIRSIAISFGTFDFRFVARAHWVFCRTSCRHFFPFLAPPSRDISMAWTSGFKPATNSAPASPVATLPSKLSYILDEGAYDIFIRFDKAMCLEGH
jgi:hypothetical protein